MSNQKVVVVDSKPRKIVKRVDVTNFKKVVMKKRRPRMSQSKAIVGKMMRELNVEAI